MTWTKFDVIRWLRDVSVVVNWNNFNILQRAWIVIHPNTLAASRRHTSWSICRRSSWLTCSRCVVRSQPIMSSKCVVCLSTSHIVYLDFTVYFNRLLLTTVVKNLCSSKKVDQSSPKSLSNGTYQHPNAAKFGCRPDQKCWRYQLSSSFAARSWPKCSKFGKLVSISRPLTMPNFIGLSQMIYHLVFWHPRGRSSPVLAMMYIKAPQCTDTSDPEIVRSQDTSAQSTWVRIVETGRQWCWIFCSIFRHQCQTVCS